jgi:hypothetical protein
VLPAVQQVQSLDATVDARTSIPLESVYMSRSWVDVLFFCVLLFGVVYLALRDFAMDPIKEQ